MVDSNQNNAIPPEQFKSYKIVNNMPDKQALVLQNTDSKLPIQIKINQDPDYISLIITLIVALVSSIVSAWITIKLVTKSNDKLVTNQSEINNTQLKHQNEQQRNEITSRNRQEWINTVRTLISEYLSYASQLPLNLINSENLRIASNRDENFIQEYKMSSDIMRANFSNVINKGLLIDLTLSKDNPIDREIVKLIFEIEVNYVNLARSIQIIVDTEIIPSSSILNFFHLNRFEETKKNAENQAIITIKTKELLKNEWERVKNLT